jgi:hypothetical protein
MTAALLEIDELVALLDAGFGPLEPDVAGLRLRSPGLDAGVLRALEAVLEVGLPESFAAMIRAFDLGCLTIGPTAFGNSGDYAALLRSMNVSSEFPWWGSGVRPASRLMIGNSDANALLLDCVTGEVLALAHGSIASEAKVVGRDFQAFVRGIGTVFAARLTGGVSAEVLTCVALEVGAGPTAHGFWAELGA